MTRSEPMPNHLRSEIALTLIWRERITCVKLLCSFLLCNLILLPVVVVFRCGLKKRHGLNQPHRAAHLSNLGRHCFAIGSPGAKGFCYPGAVRPCIWFGRRGPKLPVRHRFRQKLQQKRMLLLYSSESQGLPRTRPGSKGRSRCRSDGSADKDISRSFGVFPQADP